MPRLDQTEDAPTLPELLPAEVVLRPYPRLLLLASCEAQPLSHVANEDECRQVHLKLASCTAIKNVR